MNRLALNDDDAAVRKWFISEVKKLGCSVKVDEMGNIFAVRAGRNSDLAPIAMGSHLDTQPTGGRYDGILGVLAALEVMRAVHEADYETEYPLAVVVWTNEEGARFVPSCLGSAVYSGVHDLDYGHSRADAEGVSVKHELERHGFLGTTPCSHSANPISAHFELHIEQGPILHEAQDPVAVVTGVQGWRWYEIKLQGRGSHAGTTPFNYRKDPLGVFAQIVLDAERIAKEHGGLSTIGRVRSDAVQSTNCVMDDVVFHLDIRHHELSGMEKLEAAMIKRFNEIVDASQGVKIENFKPLTIVNPTQFDDLAVDCVRMAQSQHPSHEFMSGAGHDSVFTARNCPTAMIFIRCRDGISHHPSEYSTPEDIVIGAETLLEAVLSYEKLGAARV